MLAFVVTAIGLAPRPAATAPADEYNPEHLEGMLQVGLQELDSFQERCANAKVDPEASAALARAAAMVGHFALLYPYPAEAEPERIATLRWAIEGYERAFTCNPGWERRGYLDEGITLIERRLKPDDPARFGPLAERDEDALVGDQRRLKGAREGLTAPKCLSPEQCRRADAPPEVKDTPQRGYRARWSERLALSVELGGGGGNIRFRDAAEVPVASLFVAGLAPGVRFVVGARRRAILLTGFHYGFFRIQGEGREEPNAAHSLLARLGAGARLHPRWFSAHLAFELGVGVVTGVGTFGRGLIGGSASLCTWGEALCASVRGLGSSGGSVYFNTIVGLVGIDIFRIVDNALGAERAS